jgi:hypothetical protein
VQHGGVLVEQFDTRGRASFNDPALVPTFGFAPALASAQVKPSLRFNI